MLYVFTRLVPLVELFASLDYRGDWSMPALRRSKGECELWIGPINVCISRKKRKIDHERLERPVTAPPLEP